LCSRLFLLSSSHHLRSTCINCLLSLVVQVDFILIFYLWVFFSLIPKLQHTFLPLKCCELENMLWSIYFFHCFNMGLIVRSFKKFGGTSFKISREGVGFDLYFLFVYFNFFFSKPRKYVCHQLNLPCVLGINLFILWGFFFNFSSSVIILSTIWM